MVFLKKFKIFNYTNNFKFKVTIKHNKIYSSSAVIFNDSNICYSNIKSFKHQHITLISLNRPDDKNRLNVATVEDLKKAISNYEKDCSSTVAILYGEGGSFCAGFEPEELVKTSQIYNEFLQSQCQKPIIAAVSGFACDIGFDLCLWCDMRIIEENAVISIDRKSHVPKSKYFLKRLLSTVGYSKAMDLLLTGRDLNPKEAFECGLANRLVACGSSVGQAVNLACNIGKFPQEAVKSDRNEIHELMLKK